MTTHLRDTRGFVLTVVIFAVAALSIAGTALFLVVQSENAMANTSAESSRALHLANAGLSRYMGETFGQPRSPVTYEMGGGTVTVTAQRVLGEGDTIDVYMIRAEGVIADLRVPNLVARRSVQQFAQLRRRPFNPVAALTVGATAVQTHNNTIIDGRDACATRPGVGGLATLGRRPNNGSVSSHVRYGSLDDMLGAIDAEWETVTDPAFAFDYQDEWPSWAFNAPADSFPTVRFSSDVTVGNSPPSGRGLLVVDGKLTINSGAAPWTWDGIIMAGTIEFRNGATANINGALLSGFEGTQGSVGQSGMRNLRIQYNSCNVSNAAARMSVFSPVANTWWETSD